MFATKGLNILEHQRQRSVVEPEAQGGEIAKKSPRLIGGDAPFPFTDEQRIENLGAPEGRHQGLVPSLQQVQDAHGGNGGTSQSLESGLAQRFPIIARRTALVYNPCLTRHGIQPHNRRALSSYEGIAMCECEHQEDADSKTNTKADEEFLGFHLADK